MAAPKKEHKRTPHFLWCQDMDRILMRLEIDGVKVDETKLDITRDTFSFSYKEYELKFSFRFPVNPKTIKYRSTRLLELVIEKETSNAYWPHLLTKQEKKKLKNQCKVDWDRFLDEDDAKKRQKGVIDDDDEYGNLGNLGGNDEESSSDDSDDKPIDDLEVTTNDKTNDKTKGDDDGKKEEKKEEEKEKEKEKEEDEEEEMPPLLPEENVNDKKKKENDNDDKPKGDKIEEEQQQNDENKDKDKDIDKDTNIDKDKDIDKDKVDETTEEDAIDVD